MISFFCFAAVAVIILVAAILKRDIFTPINVFLLTQFATLGIAYLQLDPAMTDFHAFTWIAYGCATAALVMGALLPRLLWTSTTSQARIETIDWKRYHLFSWLVFIAFLICCIPAIQAGHGLPLLSKHLGRMMSQKAVDYGYFAFGYAAGPLPVLLFATSMYKEVCPNYWIRISSRIMTWCGVIAIILLNPTRGSVLCALGMIVISRHYLHKRISAWTLPLFCLIIVPIFIALGYAKSQYSDDVKSLPVTKVLHLPYVYIANNYWNVDYALNPPNDREIHPFTWGLDALNGPLELTHLTGAFRTAFHWDNMFNHRIEKVPGLNTTGYLWQPYKDFREFGVVGIPLIIGLFWGWLYLKQRQRFSLRIHLLYVVLIYLLGWWWFNESYKSALYWIWAAIILIITDRCTTTAATPLEFLANRDKPLPLQNPARSRSLG